ncbi:MAG: hypothetical protein ACLUVS_04130 [Oscillospiraceae bacterium]
MPWRVFCQVSTSPFIRYLYMNTGSRRMGQTPTHLPQRMHWGCSSYCSSLPAKASMAPVPLPTVTSTLYWARPIMGPPMISL